MSGNRTRGVCVTGRNVTNYTNTDLFLFQNLKHCLRPLMFEFQRVRCCNRDKDSSFDHTMVDTPHPIRTAKLSTIGPDQYCGGGPRGNLGCRMFFFWWIPFFLVSFGPLLIIFLSKTGTGRPIVHIPLVFLAAFFPFFTVFLALFLVFFLTKTVCIHVWGPCSVSKYGGWMGINGTATDVHRTYSYGRRRRIL